jgi:hypothetical protein
MGQGESVALTAACGDSANSCVAKYAIHDDLMRCDILTRTPVMERDRRLTGFMRGQTDKPIAPEGFELNNPWRVCIDMARRWGKVLTTTVRTTVLLSSVRYYPVGSGLACFTDVAQQQDTSREINDNSSVHYCSLFDLRWKSGYTLTLCIAKLHPKVLLQCL